MNDEAAPPSAPPVPPRLMPDFEHIFAHAPRPLLVVANDDRFTMVAVNAAHASAFGSTPQALTGWGVFEVFPPDSPPAVKRFVESVRTSFDEVLRTGRAHQMETRAFAVAAPDGRRVERYWSAINTPVRDADGVITHIASAVQDVTGEVRERRADEARNLLMREVDHRARNALTIVQSLVRLTKAGSVDSFREILEGRVEALARAQTSLAARHWEGADLREIFEAELSPLSASGHYDLSGPKVLLRADHVQSLSMLVHELATNACKYGALSTQAGRVGVHWWSEAAGALGVAWTERGGPPTSAPEDVGFGTRLIAQLARQLGGEATLTWRPEGLDVRLWISLATDYTAP